jgi:hypothetical protein
MGHINYHARIFKHKSIFFILFSPPQKKKKTHEHLAFHINWIPVQSHLEFEWLVNWIRILFIYIYVFFLFFEKIYVCIFYVRTNCYMYMYICKLTWFWARIKITRLTIDGESIRDIGCSSRLKSFIINLLYIFLPPLSCNNSNYISINWLFQK